MDHEADVANSESDCEARESLNKLQETVQKVLEQNHALVRRLEQLDFGHGLEDGSVKFFDDDRALQDPTDTSRGSWPRRSLAPLPRLEESIPLDASINHAISPREFEALLYQSRVYARVQSNESDASFSSSAVRTNAWSMLSGLSLNDISVISVIALPISLEDITSI